MPKYGDNKPTKKFNMDIGNPLQNPSLPSLKFHTCGGKYIYYFEFTYELKNVLVI